MIFLSFYIVFFSILAIFLQNFFIGITDKSIFFSIVFLVALVYHMKKDGFFVLAVLYSFLFDLIFSDGSGIYFLFFILLTLLFKLISQNILSSYSAPMSHILAFVFSLVFVILFIHNIIAVDNIKFSLSYFFSMFYISVFSVVLFVIFGKMFDFMDKLYDGYINQNSKKHI